MEVKNGPIVKMVREYHMRIIALDLFPCQLNTTKRYQRLVWYLAMTCVEIKIVSRCNLIIVWDITHLESWSCPINFFTTSREERRDKVSYNIAHKFFKWYYSAKYNEDSLAGNFVLHNLFTKWFVIWNSPLDLKEKIIDFAG